MNKLECKFIKSVSEFNFIQKLIHFCLHVTVLREWFFSYPESCGIKMSFLKISLISIIWHWHRPMPNSTVWLIKITDVWSRIGFKGKGVLIILNDFSNDGTFLCSSVYIFCIICSSIPSPNVNWFWRSFLCWTGGISRVHGPIEISRLHSNSKGRKKPGFYCLSIIYYLYSVWVNYSKINSNLASIVP